MKTHIRNPLLLPVLVAALGLVLACQLTAQTFITLYSFTLLDANTYINSDGGNPQAGLILLGNTLYGTTLEGSPSGWGTLFKVNTDATGFKTLHSFSRGTSQNSGGWPINTDGAWPAASLIFSGNTLFGTADYGGVSGNGTVFAINLDGNGFKTLHDFTGPDYSNGGTNSDGASPVAGLILSSGSLYGTTSYGGASGKGVVFSLKTDGTGFTALYSFRGNDGANPNSSLVLSTNTLYGTTLSGGDSGYGTVFKINTDGTSFTNLYSFTGASDGAYPKPPLILSGNTLYGASSGGSFGQGTVFALSTDGTGFTVLYDFNGSDKAVPHGLILSGNTLYGATSARSSLGTKGAVFAVKTDGTGFTNIYSFTGGSDGGSPNDLMLSGNTFYGTEGHGGASGSGSVFSVSLGSITLPQLTITPVGPNVILTWPTDATSFALQSTTNLGSPFWTTNSPAPIAVNGLNTVTNPISGTQQFFRLSQ